MSTKTVTNMTRNPWHFEIPVKEEGKVIGVETISFGIDIDRGVKDAPQPDVDVDAKQLKALRDIPLFDAMVKTREMIIQ